MQQINKITENQFGFRIDYDNLTYEKAVKMSKKIFETVSNIRKSSAIHTAEKDPQYLEMLIVYEGLSRFIDASIADSRRRKVMEGELGKSEAMLAAKDMVDTAQDMIEKVGKMQNEQLPALIDSIRDQIGSAQADSFKGSVGQVLAMLVQQLSQSRESLDVAARALTGEASAAPSAMTMPGDDMGSEPAMDGGDDMDSESDGFAASNAAAGGTAELGRERR